MQGPSRESLLWGGLDTAALHKDLRVDVGIGITIERVLEVGNPCGLRFGEKDRAKRLQNKAPSATDQQIKGHHNPSELGVVPAALSTCPAACLHPALLARLQLQLPYGCHPRVRKLSLFRKPMYRCVLQCRFPCFLQPQLLLHLWSHSQTPVASPGLPPSLLQAHLVRKSQNK